MPFLRPHVFFDTCIYIEVEKPNGLITPRDWKFIQHYIRNNFRTRVSWPTLKELLVRVANGDEKHFVENQMPLKELYRHGRSPGQFLDKPHFFAIETVLGIDARPALDREGNKNIPTQKWAEGVLTSLFLARSKAELLSGVKLKQKKTLFATADLDDFVAYEEEARSEYVSLCEGLRTGTIDKGSHNSVSGWLLKDCGLEPYTKHCEALSNALDAAYSGVEWIWNISKNNTYDFDKNKNDWDDLQQLYYLCDPSMWFVTLNRKDFLPWTKNSTQRSRVVLWKDFVALARTNINS